MEKKINLSKEWYTKALEKFHEDEEAYILKLASFNLDEEEVEVALEQAGCEELADNLEVIDKLWKAKLKTSEKDLYAYMKKHNLLEKEKQKEEKKEEEKESKKRRQSELDELNATIAELTKKLKAMQKKK